MLSIPDSPLTRDKRHARPAVAIRFPLTVRVCAAFLLLGATPLTAQWIGTLSLDNGYFSNAFGVASGGAASMSGMTLSFGYLPENGSFSSQYSGALVLVPSLPDQQYSMHALNASYAFSFDSAETFSLTARGGATARLGQASTAAYDFLQGAARMEGSWQASSAIGIRAEYGARLRSYPNLAALGFLEHAPRVGMSVMLESRTSVHAEAYFGLKQFTASPAGSVAGSAPQSAATGSGLTVDGGGPGGGGDGGPGTGNGSGGGGRNGSGGGMNGSGGHAGSPGIPLLTSDQRSLSSTGFRLTVAQGLSESVGLSLQYRRTWALNGNIRAFIAGVLLTGADEELVDDPYTYGGDDASLLLTSLLPWSVTMRASAFAQSKRYAYAATLDGLSSAPDRADTRFGTTISLEKSFDGSWLLFDTPVLTVSYQYARNQSNAAMFDYSGHTVAAGLEIAF